MKVNHSFSPLDMYNIYISSFTYCGMSCKKKKKIRFCIFGISLNALLMSIFANNLPSPSERIFCIASSTEIYDIEQRCLGIPSFTLLPLGWERSMMSIHLFGFITPKRLTWEFGIALHGNGPATRCACTSSAR